MITSAVEFNTSQRPITLGEKIIRVFTEIDLDKRILVREKSNRVSIICRDFNFESGTCVENTASFNVDDLDRKFDINATRSLIQYYQTNIEPKIGDNCSDEVKTFKAEVVDRTLTVDKLIGIHYLFHRGALERLAFG